MPREYMTRDLPSLMREAAAVRDAFPCVAGADIRRPWLEKRATIALTLAAKAYAFLKGRGYVTPQDVKSIGMDVLRHRVAITYEAEAEDKTSETVIQKIFDELPVP